MFSSNGLYGHIRRNTLKSVALMVGFTGLIAIFWYAWCAAYALIFWPAKAGNAPLSITERVDASLWHALDIAVATWWIPVAAATSWFVLAYFFHAAIIRLATRSSPVTPVNHAKLHRMVERLAITAGIPRPSIEIIPSSTLNAFAAGLSVERATLAVTRGLIETLDDDELETVIAHEITHIKNCDVRLMVVAGVFAGGLTLLGGLARTSISGTTSEDTTTGLLDLLIPLPTGNDDDDFAAPGRFFVLLIACMTGLILAVGLVVLVHLFALIAKYAVSQSREYLADAGAVELTKNPDALIRALQKVSGRDRVPLASGNLRPMLFSADPDELFSTHPTIDERIAAIVAHAGGHMPSRSKTLARPKGRKFFIPARGSY